MPQTPAAISNLSLRPANLTVVKALSQPSEEGANTFASLLGGETRAPSTPVSKKLRSGAKTKDDLTSRSDDANATSAGQLSQGQLATAGLLPASMPLYIPGAQHGSGNATPIAADKGAKSSETTLVPDPASAINTAAKGTEALRTPSSAQGAELASSWETPDVQSVPDPSAASLKVPNSTVVVRSETYFAPEATKPGSVVGNALPSQAAPSSAQNQTALAGQTDLASSQQQFSSDTPNPSADLRTDISTKIAGQGSQLSEQASTQPMAFVRPRTQAPSQTAQELDTLADGSSFAETQAKSSANIASNSGQALHQVRAAAPHPTGRPRTQKPTAINLMAAEHRRLRRKPSGFLRQAHRLP